MTKKIEKPKREVTKRQLSHWQQQKKRQRIILGIGIFIIVAVLGIIGTGWYIKLYQPLHQTAIKVNDTEFNMSYFVKALKFFQYPVDTVVTIIERNELIRQGADKLGISVSDDTVDTELKSHNPPFNDAHSDEVRTKLLVDKLRDEYFDQKVPVFAEQRHIMAMFLESGSQANEVRTRLDAGENFAELASELSL